MRDENLERQEPAQDGDRAGATLQENNSNKVYLQQAKYSKYIVNRCTGKPQVLLKAHQSTNCSWLKAAMLERDGVTTTGENSLNCNSRAQ